jgi:hypothetical protein
VGGAGSPAEGEKTTASSPTWEQSAVEIQNLVENPDGPTMTFEKIRFEVGDVLASGAVNPHSTAVCGGSKLELYRNQ